VFVDRILSRVFRSKKRNETGGRRIFAQWEGNVTRVGKMKKKYKMLVGRPEGN